jgi:hypothetical protein
MERGGLHDHQVVGVRGFADTHLRVPDKPYDSRNRRVSIIVMSYDPRSVEEPPIPPTGPGGAKVPGASPAAHGPAVAPSKPAVPAPGAKPAAARKPVDHSTH